MAKKAQKKQRVAKPKKNLGKGKPRTTVKEPGITAEINVIKRSFVERWPLTIEQRQKALDRLHGIIDRSLDERAVVAATRALAAFDTINLEQEQRELDRQAYGHGEQFDVIIDSDPDIARLECELADRRAELAQRRQVGASGLAEALPAADQVAGSSAIAQSAIANGG